jgi:uncharacterized protein (UPF0335 family)
VYQKPTHTGRYLHFKSDHPKHVKTGTVRSSFNRAKVICQEQKDIEKKNKNIKQHLTPNGYPQHLINSIIKSGKDSNRSSESMFHGSVGIPYVRGISEKSKALQTTSISGQFSKPDAHSEGL